jgi:hypothetical protein
VSGNIDVQPTGIPTGASGVQYFVDGKPVSGPDINTATLSNGKHTVTVQYTNAAGQTVTESRTIMVDNRQSLAATLAAAVQTHKWQVVVVAFLLLLIPVGILTNSHFHWVHDLKTELQHTAGPGALGASAREVSDPGAVTPVMHYPDPSDTPPAVDPPKPVPPAPKDPA